MGTLGMGQIASLGEKSMSIIASNTRSMILCGSKAKESTGKLTIENRHYHAYINCIKARNAHFDPSKVNIQCSLEDVEINILKERLY